MSSNIFSNFSQYNLYSYPTAFSTKSVATNAVVQNLSQNVPEESVVNEKTVGIAALLQAIAIGLQKGSSWLARKLESGKEFTSSQNVRNIAAQMVNDNKLNGIKVCYINDINKADFANTVLANEIEVVAKGKNAFYANDFNLAVAPDKKPSLILHELGHACNAKKPFMRLLQKSRRYATSAPMILLVLSRLFGKDKDGKPNFINRNAGILGFAAFLPTIIEEAAASIKGINAIKKVPKNLLEGKLNTKILKRNYLLALGTYILAGVGLGVASKQAIIENQ